MKKAQSAFERFEQARAEANAFIDKRAAEIAKEMPGVPIGVIRNSIAPNGCACLSAAKLAREAEPA